ncbi:DUF2384 domain-containing protein [Coralloluteibacterium stylophorae]|uniref:DUF2384 domain-containing protein n=1 Tax=Coralloluteibacterium stylophorae TaxID=1776034 RepID=A0A8J7VWW3_9GAMM|nr:DUF2384 domain-containing protein [Coralloluteibacterium stylophorae]MBS7455722.1 DUF2384 domain-containing protein [Coralloluteibacterium stylophorae]
MNAILNHDYATQFLEDLREPGAAYFSPSAFSSILHISAQRLAELAKVHRTTTTRSPDAEKLQDFLRGAATILAIAVELSGGDRQRAVFWFRNVPLLELDGRTAEQLVADGAAEGVRDYLINLSAGATG